MAANDPVGELRLKYGMWVVTIGLVVALMAALVGILKLSDATSITAVVGSLTAVVGTVVGAFFGVQVGAAGKEKAEAERSEAQNKLTRLAAAMPPNPEQVASILGP